MRIGIDATALPPRLFGAGNYIVLLTQALLKSNSENQYVVFTKPQHAPLFEESGNTQVIRVPLSSRVVRIAWEQTALPWLTHRHRLDILHSPHYTIPIAVRCASVVTIHDLTFFLYPEVHLLYKKIFFRAMIPLAARNADAIIADSESTRQDAIKLLQVNPERIFAVPLGLPAHFKPLRDSAAISQIQSQYHLPERFILCVGELQPRKNLPNLIRAYGKAIQSGATQSLVLAGKKGWMYDELFSVVEELGLENRVHFTGYVPEEDLPKLYCASDLFVYPSLYEGFGLPVLEAMACGVPVVTSNISSMPEVAGDAGILVNPNDVDELGDAMVRVLRDRELHKDLSCKGLERAKLYSWERAAAETLAIYEHVVRKRTTNKI